MVTYNANSIRKAKEVCDEAPFDGNQAALSRNERRDEDGRSRIEDGRSRMEKSNDLYLIFYRRPYPLFSIFYPLSSMLYPRSSILDVLSSILYPRSLLHSCLSATIGSIFMARRAGTQQARRATTINKRDMPAKVAGSVALTPNSSGEIVRVRASEPANPIVTPIIVSTMPCPTISFSMSRCPAPTAIRTPISCVRCATE